jgi:hypothetical protein
LQLIAAGVVGTREPSGELITPRLLRPDGATSVHERLETPGKASEVSRRTEDYGARLYKAVPIVIRTVDIYENTLDAVNLPDSVEHGFSLARDVTERTLECDRDLHFKPLVNLSIG